MFPGDLDSLLEKSCVLITQLFRVLGASTSSMTAFEGEMPKCLLVGFTALRLQTPQPWTVGQELKSFLSESIPTMGMLHTIHACVQFNELEAMHKREALIWYQFEDTASHRILDAHKQLQRHTETRNLSNVDC